MSSRSCMRGVGGDFLAHRASISRVRWTVCTALKWVSPLLIVVGTVMMALSNRVARDFVRDLPRRVRTWFRLTMQQLRKVIVRQWGRVRRRWSRTRIAVLNAVDRVLVAAHLKRNRHIRASGGVTAHAVVHGVDVLVSEGSVQAHLTRIAARQDQRDRDDRAGLPYMGVGILLSAPGVALGMLC